MAFLAHSAESYLARLIRAGHRVAIAEQTESPAEARKARGSKALVDRAIVRLVTPGTLTEEVLLESALQPTGSAAIGRVGEDWAIAAADISTGRFDLVACEPGEVAAELARLSPAETIAAEPVPGIGTTVGQAGFEQVIRPGERALKQRFGLATLDGLGAPTRAELSGRGRPSSRLTSMALRKRARGILLDAPRRIARASHMVIDAASRDSLELTRSVSGSISGSLFGELDRCRRTAAAGACCTEDIAAPLDRQGADRAAAAADVARLQDGCRSAGERRSPSAQHNA